MGCLSPDQSCLLHTARPLPLSLSLLPSVFRQEPGQQIWGRGLSWLFGEVSDISDLLRTMCDSVTSIRHTGCPYPKHSMELI